ncbi:PEP-CTERM sorting domain-containing protein [Chlorobium phaeovibrioides]|uniref:PEP-CTERM sorting domain-containing protein n=1 Tax=Chlorobium phaeovibrioides TaxID=1094 RepID=A0A3S0MQ98_CHLPH|nr:PEP-CTERM sorting domain-containing protein [Chlorobium phaeovibrioides]QEQ57675.1 PEP-CTERM sorting domain-containing protein [Chlorobium phaeovibrioides]RTY34161.1 PEP-CTERM sorting domain-containing protein [Chlorobium phaeovibrioides]RTY37782.1 PEP-CTERM sorting domain-containing protein [Chlorobium phaeovibrioides]
MHPSIAADGPVPNKAVKKLPATLLLAGLLLAGPLSATGLTATDTDPFNATYLETLQDNLGLNLYERESIGDIPLVSLDPSSISLTTTSGVRVYYIGTTSNYINTLGYSTNDGAVAPIFKTSFSTFDRNRLMPGDFIDLGNVEGGSQLDFFMTTNLGFTRTNTVSTSDMIEHAVAYAISDSPYLLLGFEDTISDWIGGADFNDLLFAVDIGAANVSAMTAAPEPSTLLILGSFLLMVAFLRNRQRIVAPKCSQA